jgi:N-acetylglucosaminylphosphatidylinositol deacetylase
MNWTLWASVPVLIFAFWMYTSTLGASFPTLQNKRILLLIAHPDDEATGDADGLGEVRKKELVRSGLQLGVGSKEDILVVEDKYALHCMA